MFDFNGKTPKKILYNGLNVAKLVFNGIVVWMEKILTLIAGYPITLLNSTGDDLVDYKIYGNSVQEMTKICDFQFESGSMSNTLGLTFEEQITNDKSRVRTVAPVTLKKDSNYIIKSDLTNSIGIRFYDENGLCTIATSYALSNGSYTFNSSSNTSIAFSVVGCTDINSKYELYEDVTPGNPIEVESVGEKTENLINYKQFKPYGSGTITLLENGLEFKGTYYMSIDGSHLISGNQYYMSWDYESEDNITPTWRIKYTDNTYSGNIKNKSSITIPVDKSVENILLYAEMTSNVHTTIFTNIMLSEGELKDYEPYGYKIPVTVRGKNLLAYPYMSTTATKTGITFTDNGDGSITLNGTSTASTTFYLFQDLRGLLPGIKIGDTITISKNANDNNQQGLVYFVCNYYDETNTMRAGPLASKADTAKGVVGSDWIGSGIYINIPKGNTINNLTLKPMIEISSEVSEYESYIEPITSNIYLKEPLRGINGYYDYIDFETKEVVRKIAKKIFDGTEKFSMFTSGTVNYFRVSLNNLKYIPYIEGGTNLGDNGLCNQYKVVSAGLRKDKTLSAGAGNLYTYDFGNNDFSSADEFKASLVELYNAGNPLEMYIVSETESTESIVLPTIQTHKGTTIMEVDTDVLPSNMEIMYYKR